MEQKDSKKQVLDEETVFQLLIEHKDFIAAILSEEESMMEWVQASNEADINALGRFIQALEDLNKGKSEEFDFEQCARVIKYASKATLTTYLYEDEPALMYQLQTAGLLTPVIDVAIRWKQEHDLEPETDVVEEFDAEVEDGVERLLMHRDFMLQAIENSTLLNRWISTQSDQSVKTTIESLHDVFIDNENDTIGKRRLEEFEDAILSDNFEELTEYFGRNRDVVEKLLPDLIDSMIEVAELWQQDKDFVVDTLIEHYNFFKAAFSNPQFIDKLPEESRSVLKELYARMSEIYTTNEKIKGLEESLTEVHFWRPYFSQQSDFLISIRDIVEPLSQVAAIWESQQKIKVSIPEIAELAITSQPYLEEALLHLKNLRELFRDSSNVDFEGFNKLFFFENRPKTLLEDPNDSNYANVRLHNILVKNLDAELRSIYDFLVEYAGKSEDEFVREAKGLIGPQVYQHLGETNADFARRLQAYPSISEYFRELRALIKGVRAVGTKNSNESSSSTQLISKEYLKKLNQNDSEELKNLKEKVDKVKAQAYYKTSHQMVDEMDNGSDDNKKYMVFFKQDSHGQPYLNTMNLQSVFGRLAAGMRLDREEYENKLKLLKAIGYYGLPKELGDINTYIRVNKDYSVFLNETDRKINGLKLLKKLFRDERFKGYFDAETQLKIQSALNALPQDIDINNIEHIVALETAYRKVYYLCKIDNYPLIGGVRDIRKSLPVEQLKSLNIYLVDQNGKEIIGQKFQVNNLQDLFEIHQVYNVLSSSDTMRFSYMVKFLRNIYPEHDIGKNEADIRKFYSKHVEMTNQSTRELNILQECLKDDKFRNQFDLGILLKIQESLARLPKAKDGNTNQIDVDNPEHIRALKVAYESVNSLCRVKDYPQILEVRELMMKLSAEQKKDYRIDLYDSQGKEIIYENFQVKNCHDLACLQNVYKVLMEIFQAKKTLQSEVDFPPKTIQQQRHFPVPGYASPMKKTTLKDEITEDQKLEKSKSLGDEESSDRKVEKK